MLKRFEAGLVSCIIPVMNGERYIGEAIASILAQTHSAVEVIVVDDGSVDGTRAAVYLAYPNVIYEYQPNAGPGVARNRGVELARGEYVALLDSDDRWLPEKLELQLATLASRADLAVVLAKVRMFWEEGLEHEANAYQTDGNIEATGFAGSTMLARREVFTRVGPFRGDIPHSCTVEWFDRLRCLGLNVDAVSQVLVERRMHTDNFSRLQRDQSHDEFLELIKRTLDKRRGNAGSR